MQSKNKHKKIVIFLTLIILMIGFLLPKNFLAAKTACHFTAVGKVPQPRPNKPAALILLISLGVFIVSLTK